MCPSLTACMLCVHLKGGQFQELHTAAAGRGIFPGTGFGRRGPGLEGRQRAAFFLRRGHLLHS